MNNLHQRDEATLNKCHSLMFLAVLVLFVGCRSAKEEQPMQPASASTPESTASQDAEPSPHPNQVTVVLGPTSPEVARLNPRIVEAYSPETVNLTRNTSVAPGIPETPETKSESAPDGMKWLIVTVELDPTEGELSIAMNNIRMIDGAKRKYRLISSGGSGAHPFTDFREYDKYKMLSPPKLIIRSENVSKQNMLFAVSTRAQELRLEL